MSGAFKRDNVILGRGRQMPETQKEREQVV